MNTRRCFTSLTIVAGACVVCQAVVHLRAPGAGYHWVTLAVLAWLATPLAFRVPGSRITITVSETLTLMSVLAFGWEPAVLTVAIDGLLTSLRQKNRRLERTLFNAAEPALSMSACGWLLDVLSGMPHSQRVGAATFHLILPAFAAASLYLLCNSALQTCALALETGASVWRTWRMHVRWMVLDFLGATSVAVLTVAAADSGNLLSLFAALPLLAGLYLTYRVSILRTGEALEIAQKLNRLYLGTVESLASAIDAKDHVTHGHIQRVRLLALRLLEPLGVTDVNVAKALEAGALLHDVGKLGVPDHILNKPGPLTPEEYEQIKRHTVIGADIVSRVDYPYPVAPVVRHHHENWDGTGYPDGLRGEDIPIAARILSVIDCYDALTSDRPYRRAMTHEAAVAIVSERRGTMYDPNVVDAFLALPKDEVFHEDGTAPVERLRCLPAVTLEAPVGPAGETHVAERLAS
jgi:putative nucleotidyltransferase with HDIG domain